MPNNDIAWRYIADQINRKKVHAGDQQSADPGRALPRDR
jgi:hypothetical protein